MHRNILLFHLVENRNKSTVLTIGKGSQAYATRSPVRTRDCAVIHYVLRGFGWFDGYKVTAGQGFYFPPGESHDYFSSEDDPWEYVYIDFHPHFAAQVVVPIIHADERGIFSFSFNEWLQKWVAQNFSTERIAFIPEVEAIYRAASILRRHTEEKSESDKTQLLYVRKAQIFIDKNIGLHLQVSDVAKAVSLNQRYLRRLFIQHTGIGIKAFITEQKMQLAKQLLTETTLSVKEIALETGFADPNAFSKVFRCQTGVSPSEFRDNPRKQVHMPPE